MRVSLCMCTRVAESEVKYPTPQRKGNEVWLVESMEIDFMSLNSITCDCHSIFVRYLH